MKILTFEEFTEAFDVIDGKLELNAETGIPSKFGKGKKLTPFKKTLEDTRITVYSLYQAKDETETLKAIKSADMQSDEMRKFLSRSAIYASRVIRPEKIDVVVTPQSSSILNSEIAQEIRKRIRADFFIDSFKKVNTSKIEVNKDHPKITPDIIKSMEKTLERTKRNGFFTVKAFAVLHRKFLKNFFELTDDRLMKKVDGKTVLIMDDIVTSGATLEEIVKTLYAHGAEKVVGLTIFKSAR